MESEENYGSILDIGSKYSLDGQYDKAIECYSKAIAVKPKTPNAYSLRGTAHMCSGNYDRAIEDFTSAIDLGDESPSAYGNRGAVYGVKNEDLKALLDLTMSIALDGKYLYGYRNRAALFERLKRYDLAAKDWGIAIGLKRDPDFYFYRARCHYFTDKPIEAIQDLKECLQIDPNHREAMELMKRIGDLIREHGLRLKVMPLQK